MTPSGRAPVMATLRVASATLSAAPRYGSSAPTAWLPSVDATRALVVPLTRSTAAPWPGPTTVSAPTVESYCSKTARRDDRFAEPSRASRTAPGSMPRSGSRSLGSSGAPGAGAARRCGRRRGEPLVDDGVAGQGRGRHRAISRADGSVVQPPDDRDVAVVGDPADDRDGQAPALAHLADGVPAIRPDGGAHPLLALRDHDLERLHVRLAPRDRVEVDEDARPGPVGGLRRRAGDAAGAEVLEALDEPALDELEARLDEQLLGERVADLDGRPLGRVVVGERRAGEDGRPADPVAPGRRAEQDDQVAGPGRGGERQQPLLEQADGHDVDERVARVGRVEDELAADRRHADAVAVAADAADDAVDEVPRPRVAPDRRTAARRAPRSAGRPS